MMAGMAPHQGAGGLMVMADTLLVVEDLVGREDEVVAAEGSQMVLLVKDIVYWKVLVG
jgi:hypothetical protein